MISRKNVVGKIEAYLHHDIDLETLVDWAEHIMMNEDFDETEIELISSVVTRIGLADTRAFGLTWEDCESLLRKLGYSAKISIIAA